MKLTGHLPQLQQISTPSLPQKSTGKYQGTKSGTRLSTRNYNYRVIFLSIQNRILDQLGSGQFGEVCKALWSISGATKELAIKTLRAELPEEEKVRFLQEAAIMGQFSHPNVVKLYGVVTVGDPVSELVI